MSPIFTVAIVSILVLLLFCYLCKQQCIDAKKGEAPVVKKIKVSFYNEDDIIEFVKYFEDEAPYYAGDGDWLIGESAYEQFKDYLKESKKLDFFIVDSTGIPHANIKYFEIREL